MTKPITWSPDAQTALDRLKGRLFATVTETSAIFDYDQQGRTIRRAIESGDIPAVKVGATWRVPVAWIREHARLGADGGDGHAA